MRTERRRWSEWSRQELLDEIYYLRDVAGEREQQIRRLEAAAAEGQRAAADLDRILRSRSWRLTAPLRWLTSVLRRQEVVDAKTVTVGSLAEVSSATSPESRDINSAEAGRCRDAPRLELRENGDRLFYVDVTELLLRQGKTGVQRVTREILRALLASPPEGFVVQPVCAMRGQPYRACRPESSGAGNLGARIDPRAGDVFLGLDHSIRAVVERASDFEAMRRNGVSIWFVCNDVLPLEHPEWFPDDVPPKFEAWLRIVLTVADGVACISAPTQSALRARFDAMQLSRGRPLKIVRFGLGADMEFGAGQITAEDAARLGQLKSLTSFLMVGTLEPRKGHAQALEAFNQLWAKGEDVALVLAGLPGWKTEVMQRRIRHHDEFGERLFWFMDASDALLKKLYATCTVLLAPSEGEGFGLPLVEAAKHGLPILCRDLSIFREIAGEFATYFSGRDAESLVEAIEQWREAQRRDRAPSTDTMPSLTWKESTRQLLEVMIDGCKEAVLAKSEQGSKPK